MIFVLFVAALVVVEFVLRHEPKRRFSDEPVQAVAPAQRQEDASSEGLHALSLALDECGKGEAPAETAVPVAHVRVSGRESLD